MEFFNLTTDLTPTVTKVEPDPIELDVNQPVYRKQFNDDEWLLIGLYMTNGDCQLSYSNVFPGNSKSVDLKRSKELFKRADIIREIKRRISIIVKHNHNLIQRIIQEYQSMAFSNIEDFADWNNYNVILKPSSIITRKHKAAIMEIKATRYGPSIKFHNKQQSLDSISKIIGILRDSIDLTTLDGSDSVKSSKPVVILPDNKRG